MINSQEFVKRLQKVIDYYSESASSFAEKIGVQRSSISHILSGRNKPSLEFIMKVLSTFPDVELYWLLNGKGDFPKINKKEQPEPPTPPSTPLPIKKTIPIKTPNQKEIKRIVIFYSDGSFENFEQ